MAKHINGIKRQKGLTLLELLIVVSILGVLAVIMIPNLIGNLQKSKQRTTMAEMRTICQAVATYRVDHQNVPQTSSISELHSILTPSYILAFTTLDGWNHHFDYNASPNTYTIESYGRDGIDGSNITFETKDDFELDIVLVNGSFSASPVE